MNSVPEGTDLRQTLVYYERKMSNISSTDILPVSLCQIEADLIQYDNSSPVLKSYHHRHKKDQANAVKTFQVKCFKCGGNHRLIQCPKATPEEKKSLWAKHGQKYQKTPTKSANHTSRTSNSKKNTEKVTTRPEPDNSPTNAVTPTSISSAQANTTVIKSNPSPRNIHWAKMARTTKNTSFLKNPGTSFIADWLIDSGCSNHMTPFLEDLIADKTKSKALVEVAN